MNVYCIKCLMFTENKNIKVKRKIDGKINIYSCCNDCSFKKFPAIDKEKLSDLWKDLIIKQCYLIVWSAKKVQSYKKL